MRCARARPDRLGAASVPRKLTLACAAALAGASGLGLEILIVSFCGLTLGYGASAAIGITFFLVGWSLGARASGEYRGSPTRALWLAAGVLSVASLVLPRVLVALGAGAPSPALAWSVSLFALFLVAFPQGVFLPQLARCWSLGRRGDLGVLFAANLCGAALGAWFLGDRLPGEYGRYVAAAAAGACALGAAALASSVAAKASDAEARECAAPDEQHEHLAAWRAGLLLALATGWLGTLEWLGLRLGVLWFGGMQPALTGVLIATMLALSAGAWIGPRLLGRGLSSLNRLGTACVLASAWYFVAPSLLEGRADLPLLLRASMLVGPALLPFGAVVPMLHRCLPGESAARLGRLLLWEAGGALVGLPLSHFLLMPSFGLNGTLAAWALIAVAWPLLLSRPSSAPSVKAVGALLALLLFAYAAFVAEPLALRSPPLSNPALQVLDFVEDEHFAVAVVEDGVLGERTVLTDGFRAAGTGRDYAYMQALGHLPLLMHPAPGRVAVLAFGTGTTAGAVSLHEKVERIDVLELSAAVASEAPWFAEVNRNVLEDTERVCLALGDGRRTLARDDALYDVLTMEPLLPDSPFGVYLYTEEFYARARTALAPGGLLCQWVPPHALAPETFEAVVGAFCQAFPWSSVWVFGTQVILLGAERAPAPQLGSFPADDSELGLALQQLGLDSAAGLLARWVGSGAAWPRPERPLTDADPWIIYTRRRSGAVLLADLPINLRRLRERAERPPIEWRVGLQGDAQARFDGLAALRAAREATAIEELEARGVAMPDPGFARDSNALFAEARRLARSDPGVVIFEQQRRFLSDLRQGVGLLSGNSSAAAAGNAVRFLNSALNLRPERADVHWYMAAALERLGHSEAESARAKALELCPEIARTAAGLRVASWGE